MKEECSTSWILWDRIKELFSCKHECESLQQGKNGPKVIQRSSGLLSQFHKRRQLLHYEQARQSFPKVRPPRAVGAGQPKVVGPTLPSSFRGRTTTSVDLEGRALSQK